MSTIFTKQMKGMKKSYKDAKQQYEDMEGLPVGTYVGKVKSVSCEVGDNGPYIQERLVVLEGPHKGSMQTDFQNINEDQLKWIYLWFANHGIEPPDEPEEIEAMVDAMNEENIVVKFRRVQNGEYVNTRISGKVDFEAEDAPDAGAEDEPPEPDEPAEPGEDEFDSMDRKELKAALKEKDIDLTVYKSTTDDAIREALRDAEPEAPEPDEPEEPEEPEAEEPEAPEADDKTPDAKTIKGLEKIVASGAVKIKLNKKDTVPVLFDKFDEYSPWGVKADELKADEAAALKAIGVKVAK